MHRKIFKYLTLFSLPFVLNGCYTLLSDPLKISPKPKVDIHNIEKQDKIDEPYPMVNRYYGRRTHDSYVYGHNGYYGIVPRYHNGYNSYDHYHIHDVPQSPVSQAPTQQRTKVEVKNTPTSRDVERAKIVWQKRIEPRLRKAPTPIRRQKDGE